MTAWIDEPTICKRPALRLCNEKLELTIVPALGGKMTSLRSCLTGREWLWTNPHLSQRDPTGQTDYIGEFDTGGWDEVFPTIEPCRLENTSWGDVTLADHGEIWRRPASVTSTARDGDAANVRLTVLGEPLPFTFERTLSLAASESRVELQYRLTNNADQPLPYIWAAHPLFSIEPGMRISMPHGAEVRCTGGFGDQLPKFGRPFLWPMVHGNDGSSLDLSHVPETPAGAFKLFTRPLDTTWVMIASPDGRESIRIELTGATSHCFGIWLNFGGWSGCESPPYFNVGIEPTTSPCDNLNDAISEHLAAVVLPGKPEQWTITTTLIQHEEEIR